MKATSKTFAILGVLAGAGCAAPVAEAGPGAMAPAMTAAEEPVRNIILMIADGAGIGHWTAAEMTGAELAVKRMPVLGLVDTQSGNSKVTDSAAGASVYATGQRVTNRTISVEPGCPQPRGGDTTVTTPAGCAPIESWFAVARRKGKATGVVTTTFVVDATPAAFVGHSPSRYWGDQLAEQFVAADLDVMLGGGRRHFAGATRNDGRDLLGTLCARATCVATPQELAAYQPDARPLVGLFTEGDMGVFDRRPVTLPAMVEAALAKLAQDPDGFVALFESEGTDNAAHANEPQERIAAEMLEFNRAVGIALDFAQATPGTLVVVTADHETGGLSLPIVEGELGWKYTTGDHTAGLVPIFALGPRAQAFGGFRENYEIGRGLHEIVAGW